MCPQVLGQGIGRLEGAGLRKELRRAVRYAYQTFEVYRMQYLNIRNPTWYRMWVEAQRRGGRLMTYAEAKLYIDKNRVLYRNRDYWAAVTNPNERRARNSKQGKKDWIQLGSRPHPVKRSHSAHFGYPGWGDNSHRGRGGATTSVLLYVTKSRRRYVEMTVKVETTCFKGDQKIKCTKLVKRKVPVKVSKKSLKLAAPAKPKDGRRKKKPSKKPGLVKRAVRFVRRKLR